MNRFSFALMSGGESRRFGSDKTKALLKNKPLYMYGIEYGLNVSDDVMLASRQIEKYKPFLDNVKYLLDEYENQCPMAGMITAANYAKYNHIFILSADAPFVNSSIIKFISEKIADYDAVIPNINGKKYNLSAIYKVTMLKSLLKFYNEGIYKLKACYENYNILFLDENSFPEGANLSDIFLNINTQSHLEHASKL